jgi:hypothetical protein
MRESVFTQRCAFFVSVGHEVSYQSDSFRRRLIRAARFFEAPALDLFTQGLRHGFEILGFALLPGLCYVAL